MPKIKDKTKEILLGFLLALTGVVVACGGGGSGSGQAGNQAVLRLVNVTQRIENLGGFVDGELVFPQVLKGQPSEFESLQEGSRLIELIDNNNPEVRVQVNNDFAFSIPYTLILSELNGSLTPILVVNDRSDTPQTQFRIRAVNAGSQNGLTVRLEPAASSQRIVLRAEVTATPAPSATATPQNTALPTATVQPQASATISVPQAVLVAPDLNSTSISDYVLANRGDYIIRILRNGVSVLATGAISYQAGQVETIVVSGTEGNTEILRLNDSP